MTNFFKKLWCRIVGHDWSGVVGSVSKAHNAKESCTSES